jgi:glycosyltransferase involved in cell wall biosynthesis
MANGEKVFIIGPAHPLRGGLASFNERLARAFIEQGANVTIYTFSLQYPNFLFPGTTQYSSEPAPKDLSIRVLINSVNPFNWIKVGWIIRQEQPDIVVVRYWLPFMGPALGTILRIIRTNKKTRIVTIADNVIPHEKRIGDTIFTKYFLQPVHAFVTMSEKVMHDLRSFTQKPAQQVVHPLYDNFGEAVSVEVARVHLNLPIHAKIVLFFGFIRSYKGLDLLLKATALLKKSSDEPIYVLVAGEFYEDRTKYDELITSLAIEDRLFLRTEFISDSDVKYYLSAADFVIQPYKHATQSGVTPLSYHFEKPMLVTNVGGLPDLVPHQKVGWIVEPNPTAIAEGIHALYQLGVAHFLPHLRNEKKKYSWEVLANTIRQLATQ